jgi:predicted ATPase/DNA-binding SARP family transcriptional activator
VSSPVRIDVLGPLRVLRPDGGDTTPRAAQQRLALMGLVAARPDGVLVDDLVELLWPGGAPSANALQAVLSKLRKVISPIDVVLEHGRYVLRGDLDTDLDELDRVHAAGDVDAIESLVRGVPLTELGDEPLAVGVRRRVDALVGGARARRLESIVRGPDPGAALPELTLLGEHDPHDERWWALRMIAQYRTGNQAAALRLFQDARTRLGDDLGLEPGPELREVERQILGQAPELAPPRWVAALVDPAPAVAPSQPLPARLASFVGRSDELDQLAALVAAHRLVTLLGPGGVGKTTISLELARRTDRVGFIELASHGDRDSTVRAFARAIGLPDAEQPVPGAVAPADPADRVVDALVSADLLLVVDNCEHVVDDVAALVHRILVGCPLVRVLATSREALGVPGEFVFPLPPLPAGDAVELFVERARAHAAGPALDHTTPARLAELCERLDGLPLAIELAAARLRTTSVDDLIDRLDDRFTVLSNGSRTVEPRQQTLRAVVDWSHDLLAVEERVVFRRLSVFVGGASPAATIGACSGAAPEGVTIDAAEVDDIIQRLVDKSLVVVEHTVDGPRRTMLETLRDYAAEQLAAAGELERVLVRHAQYFADFIAPARLGLVGADQVAWFTRVGRERRNLDAALETALARNDAQLALELTMPLGWYYYMTGEIEAGADSMAEALACGGPTDPDIRAGALGLYGWLLANGPMLEQAVAATNEAVSMLDRVEDGWVRGMVMNTHVMALFFAGHLDQVDVQLPRLRAVAEESDDEWVEAITGLVEAEILQVRGHTHAAQDAYLGAAAAFERHGDRFAYALALTQAAEVAETLGEYDRAVEMLCRGLEMADEVGFSGHPLAMRGRLANVEVLRGNLDVAEAMHRSLLDDSKAMGVTWLQAMSWVGMASIARRRGDFDLAAASLDRAWAMPRTQTVPYMRAITSVVFGYLADQRGDAAAALAHQIEGLLVNHQIGAPRPVAYSMEGAAGALAIGGDADGHRLGAMLLGHADRLRRGSGGPMPPAERFDVDRAERRLRGELGDEVFDECFAAGAAAGAADLVQATVARQGL